MRYQLLQEPEETIATINGKKFNVMNFYYYAHGILCCDSIVIGEVTNEIK
jgi:hypothetical protein